MKPFTELMIEVDNAICQKDIKTVCDYLNINKRDYPLIELWFAKEHISEKIKDIVKNDFKEIKDFLTK